MQFIVKHDRENHVLFGPALRALHVPEPPGSGAASCTGGGVVAVGPVAEM